MSHFYFLLFGLKNHYKDHRALPKEENVKKKNKKKWRTLSLLTFIYGPPGQAKPKITGFRVKKKISDGKMMKQIY